MLIFDLLLDDLLITVCPLIGFGDDFGDFLLGVDNGVQLAPLHHLLLQNQRSVFSPQPLLDGGLRDEGLQSLLIDFVFFGVDGLIILDGSLSGVAFTR